MEGAPAKQVRTAATAGVAGLAAQLVEFHAVLQQRLAIRRVTTVHGRYVRGLQGVGQQADRHACIGAAGEVHQPGLPRYEIRRDHYQLMVHAFQLRRQLGGEQQAWVWVGFGQHLARRIPQCLVPRPDQLAAPDVHARLGLVGAQAVIQRVILLARFGQRILQAHACGGQVTFGRAA